MKKFSTFILSLFAAVSVVAAPVMPTLSFDKELKFRGDVVGKNSVRVDDKNFRVAEALDAAKGMFKSPAKAEGAVDIEGDYNMVIGDYYFEDSVGDVETTATISLYDEGIYLISSPYFSSILAFESESGTGLYFQPLKMGAVTVQGQTYYLAFLPFIYTLTGEVDPETGNPVGQVVPQAYTVEYDAQSNSFDFPADHGFAWMLYSDENYTTAASWADAFDVISLAKEIEEDLSTWTTVGEATFQDGWAMPAFGIEPDEITYKVALEQNDDNKNIFRVVNPYGEAWPLASEGLNEGSGNGYIKFDVSDPDHVQFIAVESGFANSQLGVSKFYCIDVLSYLVNASGKTAAEVIEIMGDEIQYTTYKDGVVLLPSVIVDDAYNNAACFGVQGEKYAGYGWTDKATEKPVNMEAKITFPTDFNFVPDQSAIDNIVADDANAPVEYFNLQGVKVQNPENGLYIKRQGKTVEKVVIRK